jgi:hypothetical protein
MKTVLTVALALATGEAVAAARISGLSARQSAPQEVQVAVSIERPTPLDMLCDLTIDLGDGTRKPMSFGVGDRHQKTLQHRYAKPGMYKVVAKPSGKCEGMREATVIVTAWPVDKSAAAPAKARCPSGYTLITGSFQGNKYSCSANPPSKPIRCEGGTKYFAEQGVIGCR